MTATSIRYRKAHSASYRQPLGRLSMASFATLALATAMLAGSGAVFAQYAQPGSTAVPQTQPRVLAELKASHTRAWPGQRIYLVAYFSLPKGFHLYSHNVGDLPFQPTTLSLPAHSPIARITNTHWPATTYSRFFEQTIPTLQANLPVNVVAVAVACRLSSELRPGRHKLILLAAYQACSDNLCLPPVTDVPLTATITIVEPPGEAIRNPESDPLPSRRWGGSSSRIQALWQEGGSVQAQAVATTCRCVPGWADSQHYAVRATRDPDQGAYACQSRSRALAKPGDARAAVRRRCGSVLSCLGRCSRRRRAVNGVGRSLQASIVSDRHGFATDVAGVGDVRGL